MTLFVTFRETEILGFKKFLAVLDDTRIYNRALSTAEPRYAGFTSAMPLCSRVLRSDCERDYLSVIQQLDFIQRDIRDFFALDH